MRHETIVVQTPEYVEIEYELAGIGSRVIACLVDTIVQFFITALIVIAGIYLFRWLSPLGSGNPLDLVAMLFMGAGGLVGFIAYWVVLEMVTNGQSIGKRMAGLRVVRDDGTAINLWDSIIRNVVRIVDFLPANYCVGIISVWVSGRSKRLGDYAAGTVVVKERAAEVPAATAPSTPPARYRVAATAGEQALMAHIRMLTAQEAEAAARFLERRHELAVEVRAQLANRLAGSISSHLGVSSDAWASAEEFLVAVLACHRSVSRSRE